MRLKNKVAWIAGMGAGMGKATALLFAQEGAHVIISARTNTILGKTADRIKEHGGQVTILPGDLPSNSNVSEIAIKIVSMELSSTFGFLLAIHVLRKCQK